MIVGQVGSSNYVTVTLTLTVEELHTLQAWTQNPIGGLVETTEEESLRTQLFSLAGAMLVAARN